MSKPIQYKPIQTNYLYNPTGSGMLNQSSLNIQGGSPTNELQDFLRPKPR